MNDHIYLIYSAGSILGDKFYLTLNYANKAAKKYIDKGYHEVSVQRFDRNLDVQALINS